MADQDDLAAAKAWANERLAAERASMDLMEFRTFPTWADLEREGLTCPFLHYAAHAVRHDLMTRDQALIWVAIELSKSRARMHAQAVDYLARRV